MPVVVDASVAVKWLVEEEFSDLAEALLRGSIPLDVPLMAPPHFSGEVVNALYQRTRRNTPSVVLAEAKASLAVERFLAFEVKSVAPEGLYGAAFAFARDHRLANIYDALYVTLAWMAGADLWTADLTLLRAVGSAAPWVRWIGEYEPSSQ